MSQGYDQFFKAAKNSSKFTKKKLPLMGKSKSKDLDALTEDSLREIFNLKSSDLKTKEKSIKKSEPRNKLRQRRDKAGSKKSKGGAPSVTAILLVMLGALLAGYGALFPDDISKMVSSVEIGFISKSLAKDAAGAEKTSETKAKKGASSSVAKSSENKEDGAEKKNWTSEDVNYFSKLGERKKELDRREAELAELEEELHKQKAEIEARIKKLEQVRSKISGVLKDRVKIDDKKIDRLVEFYSSMKPKQAAEIVGKLNEDLAVEVLGRMKKKNAAGILNLLEPKKARVLSEKFAGYQRR